MPTQTWQVLVLLAAAAGLAWLAGVAVGVWSVAWPGGRPWSPTSPGAAGRRCARCWCWPRASPSSTPCPPPGSWQEPVLRLLGLALIGTVGWLVAVAVFAAADLALARYDVDVADNRHARRVRTQISLLRRLTVAVIGVLAVAAMLLTFPSARAAGASLLASAGLISIVAGLAAQTSLANVFAGLQLAFTDAIRVDDVVVVEEEWGRIEEITLTYVVVHIWDDRRLILPSTYFTTTPFENWTRRESAVLGTVELDVDWSVPVDAMRTELDRLLADDPLWDRRVGVLQVTDAVGSVVRVRALLSARTRPRCSTCAARSARAWSSGCSASTATDCPRVRLDGASATPDSPADGGTGPESAALFSGSREADERSRAFAGAR